MGTADAAPELLKLLAHDLRWRLLALLVTGDYRVQELGTALDQPMNLISYHLKLLRQGQIVTVRRSDSDGRDQYYSLDLARLHTVYQTIGTALHPTLGAAGVPKLPPLNGLRLLFLCTHNSARSQLAEGITRHLTHGQVFVTSAGSEPRGVHPLAIKAAAARGIDLTLQESRGMDVVAGEHFDVVITVCDRVREICPAFPGETHTRHWSLPDPLAVVNEDAQAAAFEHTAAVLTSRIRYFLADYALRR